MAAELIVVILFAGLVIWGVSIEMRFRQLFTRRRRHAREKAA